jgi:uncharacterized delta-60 repeat protein
MKEDAMPARFRRRPGLTLVGAAALVLAIATLAAAAVPGDLDPTFDGDGRVTTDFSEDDSAEAVAIQGDGKIVVAGSAGGADPNFDPRFDFAVARYNTDGSLDATFGGDGKVTTDFAQSDDRGLAVALQADGKIVVAGQAFVSDVDDDRDFALARYNTDGSLDATFGGGAGKLTTDLGLGEFDAALAVAIQGDGKIVAAGYVTKNFFDPAYPSDFAVARFNADGSADLDFGTGGNVITDFDGEADTAHGVVIQGDGKIVAAGESSSTTCRPSANQGCDDFAVARYNTDGSLDPTFDGDGKVTTGIGINDGARAVAIQGDGKIVAAGQSFSTNFEFVEFALARYNTNGSLDTTFDGDGKVTTRFGRTYKAEAVAIQGDGKIVGAGVTCDSDEFATCDFALARYRADGSPDTTFGGGDGKVTTDFGGSAARGIALRGDRRLVAVGCSSCSDDSDFAVARYKICRTSSRRSSIPC